MSKGTTAAANGSDNMPEDGFQLPFGFGGGSGNEDDSILTVPLSPCMPVHTTDANDFRLILQHLLNFYTINAVRE